MRQLVSLGVSTSVTGHWVYPLMSLGVSAGITWVNGIAFELDSHSQISMIQHNLTIGIHQLMKIYTAEKS